MAQMDLTGQRFGKWLVLEEVEPKYYKWRARRRWLCRCDCGREKIVAQDSLRAGTSTNCGCVNGERLYASLCEWRKKKGGGL